MSENNLKPLIFLPPLSPTLEKLKEVMAENAKAEGIEIIEVASIDEAIQVIPVMSQSLIMSASPKQCAMLLQSCRKHIKRLESKTILLSPKAIPGKTLEKFMKIGLTECIVEPVNPKTLLYKVRLQLRSIKTIQEDQEMGLQSSKQSKPESSIQEKKSNQSTNKGDDSQENIDQEVKESLEKPDETEDLYHRPKMQNKEEADDKTGEEKNESLRQQEESEDLYHRQKVERKNDEKEETHIKMGETINGHMKGDVDGENNIQTTSSVDNTYKDKAIDGHMRGYDHNGPEQKDQGDNSSYKDEAISGHYKGQVQDEISAKEKDKSKKTLDEEILAAKEEIRKQAQQESGDSGIDKKEIFLPEEQEARRSNYQEDDLGGNYKGSTSSEENASKQKDKRNDEQEMPLTKETQRAANDQEENIVNKKEVRTASNDLTNPLMGELQQEDHEDPLKNDRASTHDSPISKEEGKNSNNEDERPRANSKGSPADEIGGPQIGLATTEHLNDMPSGSLESQNTLTDLTPNGHAEGEEEIDGYLRGGAAKKENEQVNERDDRDDQAQSDENEKNKKPMLRLEDDLDEQDTPHDDLAALEDNIESKSALALEDEDANKKAVEVEEEAVAKRRKGYQEDAIDNNWSEQNTTDSKKDKNNKSNARADHLSTHYSNKQSTAHHEENYGRDWKALREDEDSKDPRSHRTQEQKEKESLDEQTINYAKLKKEFSAIEYGSEQKEQLPYQMEAEAADISTVSKTILGSDGTLQKMSFEEIIPEIRTEEVEGVSLSFYEPNPQGTNHIIHILQQYFNPNINIHAIYQDIALRVYQQSECRVVFYRFKQKQAKLIFNGYCDHSVDVTSDQSNENLSILIREWQAIEQEHMMNWQDITIPTWHDQHFKEQINYFCFPYFEGKELYGMAIAYHDHYITDVQSEQVEILLESARGLYLNASTAKDKSKLTTQPSEKISPNEKKGFLGSFLKKVVGK